ncbi:46420_t:CDS:2 [Gigaspora margarita]|uniref:46420_t:CDS:1 n=1 Tax=Gigaspora margarita TaxID=4874 RepID=A0ABN7VRQ1_GIGMA|nr:46420_t:CDS:2 [Gigaspora margarita]
MLTWQQIKRVHGIEMKGKTPQWFQKLEQTVLENKISRNIKEVFQTRKKENSTRPFLGKVEKKFLNKKMHILEWEEANKKNLSLNSPLGTTCEVDEASWLEKEYSIANQIWSNLDIVVRKRMTIEDLYTNLTGGKEADRYRKRNYMARGLIESDLATSLLAMGITRKNKWHSFFQEKIWFQRCNEVAKWEKQVEINPKKKKTKKVSSEEKRKKIV